MVAEARGSSIARGAPPKCADLSIAADPPIRWPRDRPLPCRLRPPAATARPTGHDPMISTELRCDATAATVHELLVDVDAWSVWSPHVASVKARERRITPGWTGATRAFFAPGATSMVVDDVVSGSGYRWHSQLGPWRLDYENRVEAAGTGSRLRFTARLSGPGCALLERLVAPLSAYGQRRRMSRLARLAELMERTSG